MKLDAKTVAALTLPAGKRDVRGEPAFAQLHANRTYRGRYEAM